MSFPQIVGSSQFRFYTTSGNLPLPSGAQSGDLLLGLFSTWAGTIVPNAEWTDLFSTPASSSLVARGFYTVYASDRDLSVTVSGTSWKNGFIYAFRGYGEGIEVAAQRATLIPPNLTPTFPQGDTLWLASGYTRATSMSAPADYLGFQQYFPATDNQVTAVCYRELNAASENPGAFGTSVSRSAAATIAIQGIQDSRGIPVYGARLWRPNQSRVPGLYRRG